MKLLCHIRTCWESAAALNASAAALIATLLLLAAGCKKDNPQIITPEPQKVVFGVQSLYIETDGAQPITSKTDYIGCTFKVREDGDFKNPIHSGRGRIRGRGNATWWWYTDKRPYKLKLDVPYQMSGMPANKDWALLALHSDHSLMRESYASCLAAKIGLPYQIRQKYIRVVLNGAEQGIYIISETIENAKNRIDVKKDGFIIEKDNHTELETLIFTSVKNHNFTFKYPDDDEMVQGDDNYNYIADYINEWETALYSDYFADPARGYRKYIEPVSFAKWYLLQELCNNYEPNPYYVMNSRGSLLEAGPTWDAEWSFGQSFQDEGGWCYPPVQPSATTPIWNGRTYFRLLLKDPYFVDLVRKEWAALKPQLPAVQEEMNKLFTDLKPAAKYNFKHHRVLGTYPELGLIKFNTWEEEVAYVSDYLNAHADWLDKYLSEL